MPAEKTARDYILEKYEQSPEDFVIRSVPYFDSSQFMGEVVDPNVTEAVAYVKFAPQELSFFAHGSSSSIDLGPATVRISEAETNLRKANSTNGATDMAVEGISMARVGWRAEYASASAGFGEGDAPADVDVQAAMLGRNAIVDPFALLCPRQLQSPAMLQDAIFQALIKHSTVKIKLDSSPDFELGLAELLPSGAASSMIDANGLPTNDNRFEFPEGILWSRDAEADSELEVKIRLHRTVIVPIDLVTLPGGSAATAPTNVYGVVRVRLHGLSLGPRGKN